MTNEKKSLFKLSLTITSFVQEMVSLTFSGVNCEKISD